MEPNGSGRSGQTQAWPTQYAGYNENDKTHKKCINNDKTSICRATEKRSLTSILHKKIDENILEILTC